MNVHEVLNAICYVLWTGSRSRNIFSLSKHRRVKRIAASQEARQDQHAFGMDRPAEFDLALNIHDLAAAGPDPAGDARRLAEAKSAKLKHAQAIDLAAKSVAPNRDFCRIARDFDSPQGARPYGPLIGA